MPERAGPSTSIPSSSPRRRTARRLSLLVLLALGVGIPTGAEAAWDIFGEIRLTGGKAENPNLLDQDQPASLRRGQINATSSITLGARSRWQKTDFEFSYSPDGEFYEDSDLNQLSHALTVSWGHRFTRRLSLGLTEEFSYNPKLRTGPNGAGLGGGLFADTSITASDFRQTLTFRASGKSTLAWTYRNIQRIYSSTQLLDTSGNAIGMEYSRTFGPRIDVSTGYEFGVYSFRDGLPPQVPPSMTSSCQMDPLDPNCIVLLPAAGQPGAEDQGSARHRAFAGYAYDLPGGFHLDFDGGYDVLMFDRNSTGSVSRPFVRTSLGWNGSRFHTRVGYEQGLDEGGGILTNAELRRVRADAHVRLTDRASLDSLITRDERRSLDHGGVPAGITLTTLNAGCSFTYKLARNWALLALLAQDRQTARGTSAVPVEIRASRYALGASWNFK